MQLRAGFVSNSSSSSFIVHTRKPNYQLEYEEFKSWLNLDSIQEKYPYCQDKEKGAKQLFDALLDSPLTELEKFKCDNTYEVDLGDLSGMEETEEAYNLMHDFPTIFIAGDMVKIASKDIVIVDLGVQL